MRRLVVSTLVLLALSASSAAAAPVFVLTGSGYGHGVGMSQYGAQGYALHGSAYPAILAHYYTGTALDPGHSKTVRVLLASGRAAVTIASDGALTVGGQTLPPGSYRVTASAGQLVVAGSNTTRAVAAPATFAPAASSPLKLDGGAYRGNLLVGLTPQRPTTVEVADELPSESYLLGVVPREMPAGWHAEALKAQAVAARTYALAGAGHCAWQGAPAVCAGQSDQVYGGAGAETPATTAAVRATDGQAVTYRDAAGVKRLATTYFFSTSGGRTCAAADCFGGAVPYLVSVTDAFDSISPYHAWGPLTYTAAQMQTALGLADPPGDMTVALNLSSRVASVTARGASGTTTIPGTTARTKLGLRSTWFRIGVLSLDTDRATVDYGGSLTLSGLARSGGTRGWGSAHLQRRRYNETGWTTVGAALASGAWGSARQPIIRSDFRVVSGNATGIAQRIEVRTRVRFTSTSQTRLRGAIGPAKGGVAVTLSRLGADGSWRIVKSTTTAADGTFAFAISATGRYRAAADAGGGYLRGSATTLVS